MRGIARSNVLYQSAPPNVSPARPSVATSWYACVRRDRTTTGPVVSFVGSDTVERSDRFGLPAELVEPHAAATSVIAVIAPARRSPDVMRDGISDSLTTSL